MTRRVSHPCLSRSSDKLSTSVQRFATEAPAQAPKKKRHIVRKLVFYTSAATATFYVGSAFVAFKYPPYYDVFVEKVPLGSAVIQYGEDHDWDTLTLQKIIVSSKSAAEYLQGLVTGSRDGVSTPTALEKARDAYDKTREVVIHTAGASKDRIQDSKDKLRSVAGSLKTSVKKNDGEGSKAVAVAKHHSIQFSEGVEELVRRAEAALTGKPVDTLPTTTIAPEQPSVASDSVPPRGNDAKEGSAKSNVYDIPLPLGFEPPPGFSRPAPPKRAAPPPEPVEEKPTLPPLPLVAPAVSEFSASEPIISQLASVIDDLASYLNANPAAADKARDILDSAKVDLTALASRIDQVKEEERQKLETKLDDQTREYTIKLLELEMEAQDKLDSQEQDFRKFFEEERVKFVQAYREKLNRELQTQSEIINERCVHTQTPSILALMSFAIIA